MRTVLGLSFVGRRVITSRGMSIKRLMRKRRPAPGKMAGDPAKTLFLVLDESRRSFPMMSDVPFGEILSSTSLNAFREDKHFRAMSASVPVRRIHIPIERKMSES